MRAPTAGRLFNTREWNILTSVYGNTLPMRERILLTNALGGGDRPFTIPTSAISLASVGGLTQAAWTGFITSHLGSVGSTIRTFSNWTGFTGALSAGSQLGGVVNLGYLVNVGPGCYADMSTTLDDRKLLVHEVAHVWQGANSRSSTTYMLNSVMHQTASSSGSGSHHGAYAVTPGGDWSSYNAEQQAELIEAWYENGMQQSGAIWPYIRDKVRQGIT